MSRAPVRLLVVSDVVGATQFVNFTEPYKAEVARGTVELRLVSARDMAPRGEVLPQVLWAAYKPTALILSRYSAGAHGPLIELARADKTPVVNHIDDDLFAVPENLGADKFAHYNTPARLANLRAALEASDVVYTSTTRLADRLRRHGVTRPILAGDIACSVDPALFPVRRRRPQPVIGYMASGGHAADFELARQGVTNILDTRPDVTLEFFGSLKPPKSLMERYGSRIVQQAPLPDYRAFLQRLAELGWWAGLAPLEETPFNLCKTDIKWLEYSFAGIPTVASNTDVYRSACSDGAGMIVPDPMSWARVLQATIASPRLGDQMVSKARARIVAEYSAERLRRQVEQAIEAARAVASPPRKADLQAPTNKAAPLIGPRPKEYERWVAAYDQLTSIDHQRIGELATSLGGPDATVNVVLLGLSEASEEDLDRTLASILDQLHDNWRLLAPGLPARTLQGDRRVQALSADQDFEAVIAKAKTGFVTFVEAGDVLAPHALLAMVLAARRGAYDFLYSDEDEIDEAGARARPNFKSDWNLDLFLGQAYACRLALVPTATARKAARGIVGDAAVYRLLLRLLAANPVPAVGHVPLVLYHRKNGRQTIEGVITAEAEAVDAYLAERSPPERRPTIREIPSGRRLTWPVPPSPPLVSLIIPTRDHVGLLAACVDGLLNRTDYPNIEIVIIDNDSQAQETLDYFRTVRKDPRVRVLYSPGPFNFSALNNFGVRQSRGAVVGLLNNDLEVIEPGWLTELVGHALRRDVGAVGPMLYYGDGSVQHAGVVLGIGGTASHIFKRQPPTSTGYMDRMALTQELSAVTGACLLVRREVWDEVAGLDVALPVAFNDIDLCLRIRAAGYRNLWTPFARLLHLESASRGKDVDPARRARFQNDSAKMQARWGPTLTADPFFNPNLSLSSVDCRPAFPARVTWPWWTPEAVS